MLEEAEETVDGYSGHGVSAWVSPDIAPGHTQEAAESLVVMEIDFQLIHALIFQMTISVQCIALPTASSTILVLKELTTLY